MNTEKVRRCDKCGFLAIRQKWTRQILEADDDYRISAEPPRNDEGDENCENIPVCFIGRRDLREEIRTQEAKIVENDILAVIQQERVCVDFEAWIRGLTPKEHLEMLDREKWRAWQRADRKWHFAEVLMIFAMSLVFLFIGLLID